MKKKRVIFFLPNFSNGGAGESVFKLAKYLIEKKFSILLVSVGNNFYKKELLKFGCSVIELKKKRVLFSILEIRKIMFKESKKNYSKIFFVSNFHYANIISVIASLGIEIKIILTERSSVYELINSSLNKKFFKDRLLYFFVKIFYRFSSQIITNSKFEKDHFKNELKLKKVITIHPPSIKEINNSMTNILYKIIKIIYVGRISKEKGLDIIINALANLKNEINFKLFIYGQGPEENNIQKMINKLKIKDKINFCGYESNKKKIFKGANLFLNASKFEGLSSALVQSINFNVFPICSDAPGGNIEVIKNGKLGWSFKLDDAKDLEEKILNFVVKKPLINKKLKNSHLKNFTEEASFRKYLKLFNRL